MTETVQIAIIAGTAPTLVATAALIQSLKNGTKLIKVERVAVATHALSNSAMEAQLLANVQNLELASVAFKRLAEKGDEADKAAYEAVLVRVAAATVEYRNHQIKQAGVDAREAAVGNN